MIKLLSCLIAKIIEAGLSDKAFRKSLARLIQKIVACPGLDPGKWIPCVAQKVKGKGFSLSFCLFLNDLANAQKSPINM